MQPDVADIRTAEIGAKLRELGAYLDLEGDAHRARAYRRAARGVELTPELGRLARERRLTDIPGVGESIAGVITALLARGTIGLLERLRARWPPAIVELSQLPTVGPLRARRIAEGLAPRSLADVAELCERGAVRALPGFGKVSEARILEAIRSQERREARLRLVDARPFASAFATYLRGAPAIRRVETCAGVRRWIEVIDRLAFAVSADGAAAVETRLRGHPLVTSVERSGPRHLRAQLSLGIPCDVHVAPRGRLGVATILATGSDPHVAALRERAGRHGLDLERIAGEEPAVYARLGLPYFPPEVRDGTDELERGLAGDRFDLVTADDVTAAVHCHTHDSDGKNSIAEMARAARERGLGLLTITDHSPSAAYANGLDVVRLEAQREEIARAEREIGIRVLHGVESDILVDGSLDHPLDVLERLGIVIASIHRRHRQDEAAMTRRLVAALRQPCFKVWGHPLGRLLLRREPVPCRFEEVLDALEDAPAAIELNGDPYRLDLDPTHARAAAARGARFVLSSDAHSTSDLDNLEYAVALARRARLGKSDVLNTLPPEEFERAVRPQLSGR